MKSIALQCTALLLTGCVLTPAGELTRILAAHDDHRVQVAAVVVDLDTGQTLFAREADRLLRPASTMKVLTTAAVCRRLLGRSVPTSVAWTGDRLTIDCHGDPFLSSDDARRLVAELAADPARQPVRQLTIVDPLRDAPRFGEGWMWDDEPSSFMPAISAAAVDGGCATVEVAAGSSAAAQLLPVPGDLRVRSVGGDGRLGVTRGRYRQADLVTVRGSHDGERPARRTISVPDPARFTGHVLAAALRTAGKLADDAVIEVVAETPADFDAESRLQRPIAEIVERTNKASDNLGAELLLRLLADELGANATADGLAVLDEDVTALGLDPRSYRLADGSGVSHYTLLDAELLVRTLVDMHARGGEVYDVFRRSLPIAGVDGTLRSRMRGTAAERRCVAKTGTISGVSNLAGYVTTHGGRNLAFAILVQNFVGPARPWRELQDRICAQLAGW